MPPIGSFTPTYNMYPHNATTTALADQDAGFHEMSAYLCQTLPIVSCSMKRPTRVPASTAVRMNNASNMIAKWYQNAARPPPNALVKTSEIPKARVGAPPVREISVISWTDLAAAARSAGLIVNPRVRMNSEAAPGWPPVEPTGLLRAEEIPCVMTEAAIRALIATNDSVSMPPYPIIRTWLSLLIIFGVVPEAIRAWKPDKAPQAIVMNTNGNSLPANTGPLPLSAKLVTAWLWSTGLAMTRPTARSTMTPTFMKVDR